MRLDPLYRITFAYRERLGAGDELLLLVEGRCEGRVTGRFRGANRARRLPGGAWLPELEGAVETGDGATILLRLTGRAVPTPSRSAAWSGPSRTRPAIRATPG